jgi:hypothetical protein
MRYALDNPLTESLGSQHIGRGGVANVFKPSKEEIDATQKDNKWESAVGDEKEESAKISGFLELFPIHKSDWVRPRRF